MVTAASGMLLAAACVAWFAAPEGGVAGGGKPTTLYEVRHHLPPTWKATLYRSLFGLATQCTPPSTWQIASQDWWPVSSL